jgi:hypothetical protein
MQGVSSIGRAPTVVPVYTAQDPSQVVSQCARQPAAPAFTPSVQMQRTVLVTSKRQTRNKARIHHDHSHTAWEVWQKEDRQENICKTKRQVDYSQMHLNKIHFYQTRG